MANTLPDPLSAVNCRAVKAELKSGEGFLRCTEGQAQLIAEALHRAGISVKAASIDMGISESLLARQLKGLEHVSWQRLSLLPDAFFRELLIVVAKARALGTVTTKVELSA